MSLKKNMWLPWLWVALCVLTIFLVVPVARTITRFIETYWDVSIFGFFVLAVIIFFFAVCLYLLIYRLKIRTLSNYIWLTSVILIYVYFTLKLWKRPEEAVHFLEYGLLGYLLFRALRYHIPDKTIYLAALFIGATVGIFDEVLQWIIPLRYWDFRDIGINALSVGLCQIAIWRGIRPKLPSLRVEPRSVRIISWLLAVNLVLLGLCLSNTPRSVIRYTKHLPFLSFLQKEEAMSEYKFKHEDSEIGVFFSRLTLEELTKTDKERAEEYGLILTEWGQKKYGDFLISFPGWAHPFLHEMRVHVFRRDRRFSLAMKTDHQKERKKNLFIAYKENLILEKYFGETLQASPYKWPKVRMEQIKTEIEEDAFYRSPVSAAPFSHLQGIKLWGIILMLLTMLILANTWVSRRRQKI
jgi:VanZ family protein